MNGTARVLLIHPPVCKPGEPPAGIARLAAALRSNGVSCLAVDANLEAMRFVMEGPAEAADGRTRTAVRNRERNLSELRSGSAFRSIGHYNRIVNDLNRLVEISGNGTGFTPGLSDSGHRSLSAARSADLIRCSENPEDDPFHGYYRGRLLPLVERASPELIGLSVNFLSQAFHAFSLAGLLRRAFPRLRIALGGGLITSWMRSPGWKDPFRGLADDCVEGPGEPFLLSRLAAGSGGPGRPVPDFDGLTGPGYLSPGFILPYDASTGCWWRNCRFCPERAEANPHSAVPPDRVLSDLKLLKEKTRPVLIHFLDNALSPSILDRLAADPPGVPWYGYARLSGRWTDPGFCAAMKASGCVMLKIGLESGDPEVLERMGKGIQIGDASVILNNLRKAGIASYVYLLFGTPWESESAAARTLDFTARHHESIGYINAAVFNLPAFCEDAASLGTRPFSEGDLSLYADFEHPLGWDRVRVRGFLDRVFRRHPAVAPILGRTPKRFTSNHAPFFHMGGLGLKNTGNGMKG
ncbi:MAG: B12-binding domain-containing radical SAM protein [bacterium]|nr:B12-binding domain-containing radical SAM protein [bacterium]